MVGGWRNDQLVAGRGTLQLNEVVITTIRGHQSTGVLKILAVSQGSAQGTPWFLYGFLILLKKAVIRFLTWDFLNGWD